MRLLANAWRRVPSGQHMASQFRMLPIDRIMKREGSRVPPIAIEAVRSCGRARTHQRVVFDTVRREAREAVAFAA